MKVIHVDMDYFYAAVEIKHNQALRNKTIAVGGRPEERSVICTASYEARKFGVKAGISSYKALKLCPTLILIPPDFKKYKEESLAIHNIFGRFTDKIEPLSLDEAYLDVSNSKHFYGSATLIAEQIRRLIFAERGLTASAGIAPNKFLAKVASDWNKPNGQMTITPAMVEDFVKALPVENIFGVGKVTAKLMHDLGIKTCLDLQRYSVDELSAMFGSRGEELYNTCRGIDNRQLETCWERKSLTVEYTYPEDLANLQECLDQVPQLYNEFMRRFKKESEGRIVKNLVAKMKFCDFKRTTVEKQFNSVPEQGQYYPLMEECFLRKEKPVRLLGLGVRFKESQQAEEEDTNEEDCCGQLNLPY
jgi:DNA polymerase IV